MSENRAKHIETEKARIREYLKRSTRSSSSRKTSRAAPPAATTPSGWPASKAKSPSKTGELAKDVAQDEERKAEGERKKAEGGRRKAREERRRRASDAGAIAGAPVARRLEAARQRMNEAEAKLKEAQRQGAAEKQEEAIRELQLAKAELEEILRQLREEEIERTLAMLEARFRKMLQMQEEVYEGTVRLDKVPPAERTHSHEIEASRLSGRQSQIVVEVDKALLLLRDDGSAVAFPEAVEQMRDDMQQVVERLAQAKVGKITQGIEEDIIAALKEMIEALKKAQKDQENKKRRPASRRRASRRNRRWSTCWPS